jgi:sialate O-acetylesterase
MKQRILFSVLLSLSLFISTSVRAEIILPAIFNDHMVLQQQSEARIWGKSDPSKTVYITTSWDNQTYSTQANTDGKWQIQVNTPAAGGPFQITISDGTPVTLENVLIGEVWFCSGQSNMQMPMKGYFNQPVLGSNEAVATSTDEHIRLFTVARDKSLSVKDDFSGEWKESNPGNVLEFSATAYYFGRMIHEALGVPVGLINSSWGGTRIEPWISENGFQTFDWVTLPNKKMTEEFSPQTPTVPFNGMIAPIVGYGIKGALWYQGESNRNQPQEYEKLMAGLIKNWRSEWGIGDFSFYYAQIAPFDYGPNGLNSAFLREAQLSTSTAISNAGMASLMDVGEKNNIHPADKEIAGERLAYWALAKTYGKTGIAYAGPVLKEMLVEGRVVKLTFDNAPNGLTSFGKDLTNFMVAGENQRFFPAEAFITPEGITLISPRVADPVAVRYAFENYVVGELYSTGGLPTSSFRTDNWEIK